MIDGCKVQRYHEPHVQRQTAPLNKLAAQSKRPQSAKAAENPNVMDVGAGSELVEQKC